MTPEQILYGRALRMLTDGLQHAPAAMTWARRFTMRSQMRQAEALQSAGFTLAEISLGAGEVVR